MTNNTKKRHIEIYAAAENALRKAGGVERIDALDQSERRPIMRQMARRVEEQTNCIIDTARRNVAKAMRRARWGIMQQDNWGGAGRGAGRPPKPEDQKRQPVSTRLAPGKKELAIAVAEIWDLPGWAHSFEMALDKMIQGDRELKVRLAKMGIIVKRQDNDD